jgi:hypothetical protein
MYQSNKRKLIADLYQRLADLYRANHELSDELAAYKLTEHGEYEDWTKHSLIVRIRELEEHIENLYNGKH